MGVEQRDDDPVLRLGSIFHGVDPPPLPIPPRSFGRVRLFYFAIGAIGLLASLVQHSVSRQSFHRQVMSAVEQRIADGEARGIDADELQAAEDRGFRIMTAYGVVSLILNFVFLLLAILMGRFPVAATLMGLVLYIALSASAIVVAHARGQPLAWPWLVVRGLIILALIRSFQSELMYQRKMARLVDPPT